MNIAKLLAMVSLIFAPAPALAQDLAPDLAQNLAGKTWREQKCILYQSAWHDAFGLVDATGLSRGFIAGNDAFVASGCLTGRKICPRSKAEYDMANLLTMMTMNEGMASTFVPFSCATD